MFYICKKFLIRMKIVNCILVEDDHNFVELFKKQIESIPFLNLVQHCSTYSETLMTLKSEPIDLIFLDIFLNSVDGLTGFDILKLQEKLPPVIILTSSLEMAVESYHIGKAKDFLLKPFDLQRLLLAINRAIDYMPESNILFEDKSIFFKKGRMYQRFELDDICYFEGCGIYTKVVSTEDSQIINDTLSRLEGLLESRQFTRVHKSYLINMNKITGFSNNKFYLKSIEIPIGISYKKKLEVLFKLFDIDLADE